MSDALTIAADGLQIAANRVANVSASIVNASSTSPVGEKNPGDTGTHDLATQLVELQSASIGYEADAKAVNVAARTTGRLVNLLA